MAPRERVEKLRREQVASTSQRDTAPALSAGGIKAVRITKAGVFRRWYAVTLSDVAPTPFMEEFVRLLIKQGPAAKRVARRDAVAS